MDTETKAILQKSPEDKLAPAKAAEFALVLLKRGTDPQRLARAIRRINDCGEARAEDAANWEPLPLVIDAGLTEEEAVMGQFELICCDAVGVFLRSEVVASADETDYLGSVYRAALKSPEFAETELEIVSVPETEAGQNFTDQFLGEYEPWERGRIGRFRTWVPFKKARIMKHWAERVGAEVKF